MCLRDIDCCVLCGGLGSRLASVLGATPKILAPVGGGTMLSWLLAELKRHGARNVVLVAGHLAEAVQAWIASPPGVAAVAGLNVSLVIEPEPRATAHAMRCAIPLLASDPVLVCNGDTLIDFDLCGLVEDYRANIFDGVTLQMRRYRGSTNFINAGFTVFSRHALDDIANGRQTTIAHYIRTRALQCGHAGRFLDIGAPEWFANVADFLARAPEQQQKTPAQKRRAA